MTDRYRYTGTTLYRNGGQEVVDPGDIIQPTEAELDAFGDALEPVRESNGGTEPATEPDQTEETAEAEVADPPFDPGEYSIDDLETELSEGDYTDAELAALLDAEQAGDNTRSGAVDVIQSQLGA